MIPLHDALTNTTALGFDTAPFIYLIERHPRYADIVRDLFERVDRGSITGYTSAVTLTEVLTVPKRQRTIDRIVICMPSAVINFLYRFLPAYRPLRAKSISSNS